MLFWVSIAVLTLLTAALVVWPLVSKKDPFAPDAGDEQRRLAVFRDRKREIELERQAGRLSDDEAAQAQADLLEQLAADLPQAPAAEPSRTARAPRRRAWPVGIAVFVLVPLISFGVYRQVGSPQLASSDPLAAGQVHRQEIEAMIAQIEQRTRETPDDGEAWAMLGEARRMQGRHPEAVAAYEKATQRLPDDARLLAAYAESAALAAGGDFSGRPVELLERALRADPAEPRALALMGAAQYRLGHLDRARDFLRQLERLLAPGSEEAADIAEALQRIEAEIAQAGGAPATSGGGTPPPSTAQADPRRGTAPPAREAVPGAELRGVVTLDPALGSQPAAQGTLFVIARESGASRVPIAVVRMPGATFPASFSLDASNTMDSSRSLSSVESLEIEARLSRSGDAARRPGDLYGRIAGVRPGQHDLRIVIDGVVAP